MKLRGSIVRFAIMLSLGAVVLLSMPKPAAAISYCCLTCDRWERECYANCNDAACIQACDNNFRIKHCWNFCTLDFCKDPCGGCEPGLSCVNGMCVAMPPSGDCAGGRCPDGSYCTETGACSINPTCTDGNYSCNGTCFSIGTPTPCGSHVCIVDGKRVACP